jgi:probable HAF family extracellular repeat protein
MYRYTNLALALTSGVVSVHFFSAEALDTATSGVRSSMPITYAYTTVGPPGSTYSIAYSINDKGQVVGFYQDSNHQHGFVDSSGKFTRLILPAALERSPGPSTTTDKSSVLSVKRAHTN